MGAAHGEIPATSAGMTVVGAAGVAEWGLGERGANVGLAGSSGLLRCGRRWVWAPDQVWGDGSWARALEGARGRFPLGGGNDGERGRWEA